MTASQKCRRSLRGASTEVRSEGQDRGWFELPAFGGTSRWKRLTFPPCGFIISLEQRQNRTEC
jgi:hypothetical protein